MFNPKECQIYRTAVRALARLSTRENPDTAEMLAKTGEILERHCSGVSVYSWLIIGGVPKAAYPAGNSDDIYVDEAMTNPDICFRNGSRGYFGSRHAVFYSVYGRGDRYFMNAYEFDEKMTEDRKNGFIDIADGIYALIAPMLADILTEKRMSAVRAACDWSSVPFALENGNVGLVAYVRLRDYEAVVAEKGYGKLCEVYSGWITAAGRFFTDAVYSVESDALVILQKGKASLESLADFQNTIDSTGMGSVSDLVYITRDRCTYRDVIDCRKRLEKSGCTREGNPQPASDVAEEAVSPDGAFASAETLFQSL